MYKDIAISLLAAAAVVIWRQELPDNEKAGLFVGITTCLFIFLLFLDDLADRIMRRREQRRRAERQMEQTIQHLRTIDIKEDKRMQNNCSQCCQDKLAMLAGQFRELFTQKKYAQAKYIYDTALRVANLFEVDREFIRDLFGYGSRGEEEDEDSPDGLFPREDVKKCYEECCVKRNMGQENMAYRRYGEPVRYYPDPPRAGQ